MRSTSDLEFSLIDFLILRLPSLGIYYQDLNLVVFAAFGLAGNRVT
jgi:hypothetical protein